MSVVGHNRLRVSRLRTDTRISRTFPWRHHWRFGFQRTDSDLSTDLYLFVSVAVFGCGPRSGISEMDTFFAGDLGISCFSGDLWNRTKSTVLSIQRPLSLIRYACNSRPAKKTGVYAPVHKSLRLTRTTIKLSEQAVCLPSEILPLSLLSGGSRPLLQIPRRCPRRKRASSEHHP